MRKTLAGLAIVAALFPALGPPADAQCRNGSCGVSYGYAQPSYYSYSHYSYPSYAYYPSYRPAYAWEYHPAGVYNGRYFAAGNYAWYGGRWILQGYGAYDGEPVYPVAFAPPIAAPPPVPPVNVTVQAPPQLPTPPQLPQQPQAVAAPAPAAAPVQAQQFTAEEAERLRKLLSK